MKFLFTADWHLSRYSQDKIEVVTSLPERLAGIKNSMYQMGEYCQNNGIENMVIGGDILHGKSIIYAIAQNIMLDFFRAFPTIQFIVIDGNHDLSGKGSDAISALKSLDSEPNVFRILGISAKLGNVSLVPYAHDMVAEIKGESNDVLISHFGLNEGVLNSGVSIVSDVGLSSLVGKYKIVLLGHYHKPQEIITPDINLYYVGSPIQLDWGEKHEEKRFLIVDSDKMTVESVLTEGYKKYFEFELTADNKEDVVAKAKKAQEEGNHVNIKRIEEVDIDDIMQDFRVTDRVEKDITDRGVNSTMSLEEKLRKFLEIKKIKKDYHGLYLKVARSIIEETPDVSS